MRLKDKVAIVTGGRQGIGHACAELFAEEGATVIACDTAPPDADFSHERVKFHPLDVTDLGSWLKLATAAVAELGGIDILLNNAAVIGSYETIEDIDLDTWHHVINVNQNAVFYGMRSVIPAMRRGGGGSIINVSSIWGIVGAEGVAAYQASKGAVRCMSKNAAISYAKDRIRVNSLHPGLVFTPLIETQSRDLTEALIESTPLGRGAQPRELGYAALFLACDESAFMTGAELVIDGGFTAR